MFKTYHKTNNFRRYKNKINGFTFPKEILKDQSEMDHIYELIPKFWSYGKLMSTVEDLEISYDDGKLKGTRPLDEVDFEHVDKNVIIKMLEYNGLLLGYLLKKWPDIVDEELTIVAVKQNEDVMSFIDKNVPYYKKLIDAIEEADIEDRAQDLWIKKEFKEDEKYWEEIKQKKEFKEEEKEEEEKWGDL